MSEPGNTDERRRGNSSGMVEPADKVCVTHGSPLSVVPFPPAARRAGSAFLAGAAVLSVLAIVDMAAGVPRMLGRPVWVEALPYVATGPAAISCLIRAAAIRAERLPWALIGVGQLLYCVGSTYQVFAPEVASYAA
jgi:hypothetical protein